jgi:hypothetical protein
MLYPFIVPRLMSLIMATSTPHGRNMFVWYKSFLAPVCETTYECVHTGSIERCIRRRMMAVVAKYLVYISSNHQVEVCGN